LAYDIIIYLGNQPISLYENSFKTTVETQAASFIKVIQDNQESIFA
jgi:hypothetical protein